MAPPPGAGRDNEKGIIGAQTREGYGRCCRTGFETASSRRFWVSRFGLAGYGAADGRVGSDAPSVLTAARSGAERVCCAVSIVWAAA